MQRFDRLATCLCFQTHSSADSWPHALWQSNGSQSYALRRPLTPPGDGATFGDEMSRIPAVLFLAALSLLTVHGCFAQWTKTIDCPADRAYRDNRNDVGGQEFCEHVLPGSLTVKDGPFRFTKLLSSN